MGQGHLIHTDMAIINSYQAFSKHLLEVFGQATGVLSVSDQLLRLRQGTSSTDDNTFRTLAATSGWNEVSLLSAHRQGLDPCIRVQMLSLMIPLDWRASCRMPTGFTSTYQPTTHPKLLTSLSHLPPVLQYQNPCKWIPPSFLVRNARADCRLDSACTVQLPITTWGPAPSDQRWVLFSQNLSFPHFPCSQYNYLLQSIPLQHPPLSTQAPLATSSRRICWVAYICLTTIMPRSSESKRSKENRMDVAMWGMSPLLWS